MDLADDGTVQFTITTEQKEVFFDASGYESARVDLAERDPSDVIEVKMRLVRER